MPTLARLPALETPRLLVREVAAADWRGLCPLHDRRRISAPYRRAACIARPGSRPRAASRCAPEQGRSPELGFCRRTQAIERRHRRRIHPSQQEKRRNRVGSRPFAMASRTWAVSWSPRYWPWLSNIWIRSGYGARSCRAMSHPSSLAKRAGFKWAKSSADYPVGGGRSETVQFFAMSRECYLDLPY